jgi:thiamine kinase-like enzyme
MKIEDCDELLKELKNKYTLMSKYYRKFGYDFLQIFMHHDINLENIIKHNLFCEPEKTEE